MEYCDDDREYIRVRKTEVAGTGLPKDTMEFKFQHTFSRTALQGRAEEMRKAAEATRLLQVRQSVEHYVNQTEMAILAEAATGKSS